MKISRLFVCFVLAVLWWPLCVSGQCPQNKYGPDCRYDCHCSQGVSCDPQTGCAEHCAEGWDGSTCQRQNVALRRPAMHSPDSYCEGGTCHDAGLAVDGETGNDFFDTPCTQAGKSASLSTLAVWNVTLDHIYNISRFSMYVRHDGCCNGRINGFVLSVGNTDSLRYQECYRDGTPDNGGSGEGPVPRIVGYCGNNTALVGNVIQIKQTHYYPLTLCEVLIYICSDGWYDMECDKECVSTSECKRCDVNQLSCEECVSHKWGKHCDQNCFCQGGVSCVKTSGRCPNDACAPGYKGPACNTSCDQGEYGPNCRETCGYCAMGRTFCNTTTGECPDRSPYPRCQRGYKGANCDQDCTAGKYGADCTMSCGQCAGGTDKCNRETGDCPTTQAARCGPGWRGVKCDTECSQGYYGGDCLQRCGNCREGKDKCGRVDGGCPEGRIRCADGYRGYDCKTVCSPGRYGGDCREQCGKCRDGTDKCDTVNGVCPPDGLPCADGYQGNRCKTECSDGSYGKNCVEVCGNCFDGTESCHHTDGACEGCAAGWKGTNCKTECTEGTWGENCQSNCSVHCIQGALACNTVNGSCVGGCKAGFTGHRCEPVKVTGEPDSPAGIISGVVIAVVVIVVLVALTVVFLIRRKKQTSKSASNGHEMLATSTTQLHSNSLDDVTSKPVAAKRPVPTPLSEPQEESTSASVSTSVPVSTSASVSTSATVTSPASNGKSSEYYNVVDFSANGQGVPVDDLWEYVSKKKSEGGFKAEYDKLLSGLQANHEVSKIPENKPKSRYVNIVAYDHSRVVLKVLDSDANTTYINACYIHGYKEENKYIASQGPTPIIINDFMRMIWEQDCGKIVMLTNLMEDMKKKCEQYWPNSGSKEFGLLTVTLLDEETYADFVIRDLQLTHANEKGKIKSVKQFHFTSWPDHGVPQFATPLLNFRDKVLSARSQLKGPWLVHCSAGIGRTGTFIGLDYLTNQAKKEGQVNVPACVTLMRKQRVNMIQTQEQYQFLHEALVEALKLSECSIPSADFQATYNSWETPNPDTGKTPLEEQFKTLKEMTVTLRKTDLKAALHPENKAKNRNPKILAADSSRPFLSTPVPGGNDYINAVFLPAYRKKRAFILTQMPLPNTVLDFWRLVFEQNVSSIVMLNGLPEDKPDKSAMKYWPENATEFGPFLVETLEMEAGEVFDVRTLQITYKKQKDRKFKIKQFLCKFWSDGMQFSAVSAGILSLLENVEHWQQQSRDRPVLVHCLDGVTKSGQYCVASSVIERLKVDQEVNILQTVKQMRISRPEIITDLEQFRFLHKLILAYLESFQTYSNFI